MCEPPGRVYADNVSCGSCFSLSKAVWLDGKWVNEEGGRGGWRECRPPSLALPCSEPMSPSLPPPPSPARTMQTLLSHVVPIPGLNRVKCQACQCGASWRPEPTTRPTSQQPQPPSLTPSPTPPSPTAASTHPCKVLQLVQVVQGRDHSCIHAYLAPPQVHQQSVSTPYSEGLYHAIYRPPPRFHAPNAG